MKEDLIERLTSMLFNDEIFSSAVLSLCAEVSRDKQRTYMRRVEQVSGIRPVHVGLSEYLRLDDTSNRMEIFKKEHPLLALERLATEQTQNT